jgi:hypothetical protein
MSTRFTHKVNGNEIYAKRAENTQTGANIDDAFSAVNARIDTAIAAAYHAAGTKTCAQLTSSLLVAANSGNVYNMTDSGTTTSDFIEGSGKPIRAGDNVGICAVTENNATVYKFDLLSGFVDLTNYKTKQTTVSGSGSSTKTLTAISQNANGEITPTFSDIASASDSGKGLVQLATSIGDTVSEENNKAATEKAVRDLYDTGVNSVPGSIDVCTCLGRVYDTDSSLENFGCAVEVVIGSFGATSNTAVISCKVRGYKWSGLMWNFTGNYSIEGRQGDSLVEPATNNYEIYYVYGESGPNHYMELWLKSAYIPAKCVCCVHLFSGSRWVSGNASSTTLPESAAELPLSACKNANIVALESSVYSGLNSRPSPYTYGYTKLGVIHLVSPFKARVDFDVHCGLNMTNIAWIRGQFSINNSSYAGTMAISGVMALMDTFANGSTVYSRFKLSYKQASSSTSEKLDIEVWLIDTSSSGTDMRRLGVSAYVVDGATWEDGSESTSTLPSDLNDFSLDGMSASYYARRIGTPGSHPAIGSNVQPVYVNSNGVVSAGTYTSWLQDRSGGSYASLEPRMYRSATTGKLPAMASGEAIYVKVDMGTNIGGRCFFGVDLPNMPCQLSFRLSFFRYGTAQVEVDEYNGYASSTNGVTELIVHSAVSGRCSAYLKVVANSTVDADSKGYSFATTMSSSAVTILTAAEYAALTTTVAYTMKLSSSTLATSHKIRYRDKLMPFGTGGSSTTPVYVNSAGEVTACTIGLSMNFVTALPSSPAADTVYAI